MKVDLSSPSPRRPIGRRVALAAGITLLLGGGAAQAGADLVVVQADSQVVFESCDRDKPLASGVIAIKNIGDSRAKLRLGVLTRYSRAMLAIYTPEHLDIIDNVLERSALDGGDQEALKFSLGKNRLKRGRLGGSIRADEVEAIESSSAASVALDGELGGRLDLTALNPDEIRDLQRALRKAGYYKGNIDGVVGEESRAAISRYQASLNEPRTGELTLDQTEALSRQTGISLVLVTSDAIEAVEATPAPRPTPVVSAPATGSAGRTQVTLYAVVDPYNLVAESDESNNLVKFTGYIDCN